MKDVCNDARDHRNFKGDLTLGDVKITNNPSDVLVLSFIDSFPPEKQSRVGYSFVPRDLKEFNRMQTSWIEVERYFLGIKVNHNPCNDELVEDFRRTHNPERFRLYFVLTRPDKVKIRYDISQRQFSLARNFLEKAEKAFGLGYCSTVISPEFGLTA